MSVKVVKNRHLFNFHKMFVRNSAPVNAVLGLSCHGQNQRSGTYAMPERAETCGRENGLIWPNNEWNWYKPTLYCF